jgi:transcription initiation factor IIE alpha subunit
MSATKHRLYTGLYECTQCDARYDVEDASEDDLVCDECGADLEMEDDDEHEDDHEDAA